MSGLDLEAWFLFFYMQWRRVPDLHLEINTDDEADEMMSEIIEQAMIEFPHRTSDLDRLTEPGEKRRMIKNARVDSLRQISPFVMGALRSRGIAIAKSERLDKQFIIGSRPVVKLTHPGKTDIRHPECEMWFPISSDVMVGLGRGRRTVSKMSVGPDHVRYINQCIAKQSTMFASASPKLTASLAQAR